MTPTLRKVLTSFSISANDLMVMPIRSTWCSFTHRKQQSVRPEGVLVCSDVGGSLTSDEAQANFSEIMNGTPSIAARDSHSLAHVHVEKPSGLFRNGGHQEPRALPISGGTGERIHVDPSGSSAGRF